MGGCLFYAPKGLEVHVFCNITLSGLNVALWAPSFFLPSGSAALWVMLFVTFILDADIGEIFLNFPMHNSIQPYAGIDIQHFRKAFQGTHLNKLSRILRCATLLMGCGPSYITWMVSLRVVIQEWK
jgi:hypothetical protein